MPHSLQYNKFLLFGDSITEFAYDSYPAKTEGESVQFGFGSALQNIYTRRLDVIQRGFAGYNSRWAKKILPKILENENTVNSKVAIGTIFFGTNDAALGGPQKVPLDEYIANTEYFLDLFHQYDIKPILIAPAKHDQSKWNPLRQEDVANGITRTNENNLVYNRALKQLAQKHKVAFVDTYKLFEEYNGNWQDLLWDGVHYSGEAYKLLFNEVLAQIRDHYPELAPESLEYILPYWRDVSEDSV